MLKKFLGASFVVTMATLAFAQVPANIQNVLVPNTTATTAGADSPATFRQTHFTFDLQVNTNGFDWTGSEVSVDVVGVGSIWHASNQRVLETQPNALDPNVVCYIHNLQTPGLANNAANRANTLNYDTFITGPGGPFTVDPQFASPGLPAAPNSCAPQPPVVSTATRIRGTNPSGAEIPLAWFDSATLPVGPTGNLSSVLARFTFTVPTSNQGLIVQATSLPAPAGRQPFARLFGRTTSSEGSGTGGDGRGSIGINYDYTIYQIPEPSTIALLALGGLAGLIRRR